MPSSIVSLARVQPASAPLGLLEQPLLPQHSWRGASGRHYVHNVYGLIECPPLPKATYVLVRRDGNGEREVLHVGIGQHEAATLNLAKVRQRGAQLGANEVHVHLAAQSDEMRALVVCDLRAGQFGELTPEPDQVTA